MKRDPFAFDPLAGDDEVDVLATLAAAGRLTIPGRDQLPSGIGVVVTPRGKVAEVRIGGRTVTVSIGRRPDPEDVS
jgi:hypothetical protein